jgi:rhodanese-related sulfurtransferase
VKRVHFIALGLSIAGLGLGLVACSKPDARARVDPNAQAAPARPEAESRSTVAHRLVAAGALLLDVRTPEEFGEGHLPAALNIPVGELERRLAEVGDHARPVVVYCASGRRSAEAARRLSSAGYAQVHDLGGMSAW